MSRHRILLVIDSVLLKTTRRHEDDVQNVAHVVLPLETRLFNASAFVVVVDDKGYCERARSFHVVKNDVADGFLFSFASRM